MQIPNLLKHSPIGLKLTGNSVKEMIKNSYVIIIVLMIVPPCVSIISSVWQSTRYNQIISNVSRSNDLAQIVKTDITAEVWDIVAGKQEFDNGVQYKILDDMQQRLNQLVRETQNIENRRFLEVVGRAMMTLRSYMDLLGSQISSNALVSENESVLEEIRVTTILIHELLQDFVVMEIEAATAMNEQTQRTSVYTTIAQILILLFVTIYAIFAERSVSEQVNMPIQELEALSERIAAGDLAVRVSPPKIAEFDRLTKNLNIMAGKIQELIDMNIEEQKNLQKAEMKALQAQITPHFLYNTFDTIIWLAEAKDNEQVVHITRAFSNFFRLSLSKGQEWITVEQEFEHVANYLAIQKVRYRDILDYTIYFDSQLAGIPMLKLVLQPLVENALYHGIKKKRGKGRILVECRQIGVQMKFTVKDNGNGIDPERLADVREQLEGKKVGTTGSKQVFGLLNVKKRLQLYYNRPEIDLSIETEYQRGTTISFSLPLGGA